MEYVWIKQWRSFSILKFLYRSILVSFTIFSSCLSLSSETRPPSTKTMSLSNRASFDEYEEEKEYSWDETRDWQSGATVLSPVSESDTEIPPPPASDHSSCSTRTSSSSRNDAELSITSSNRSSDSDGSSSPPPPTSDQSCSTSSSPQTVVDCSSANGIESLRLSTFHNPGGQWSTNAANAAASVDVARVFAVDNSLKDMSSSVSLYDFDGVLEGDLGSSSSSCSSIPCNDVDPLGNDTKQCLIRSLVVMRLFSLR